MAPISENLLLELQPASRIPTTPMLEAGKQEEDTYVKVQNFQALC